MPFEVACPHCQSRLSLSTKPGEQCRCPMCHQIFLTPQTNPAPVAYTPEAHAPGPGFQTGSGGGYYVRPTSGLAVASMVLGIIALAVFCVWFVSIPCGLIAIILGVIAANETSGHHARRGGGGMAIAGLICGAVSIGLYVLLILMAGFSMSPFWW